MIYESLGLFVAIVAVGYAFVSGILKELAANRQVLERINSNLYDQNKLLEGIQYSLYHQNKVLSATQSAIERLGAK